ncbi:hypothetical protein HK101_004660, partial [Irineochytrium annulatum]
MTAENDEAKKEVTVAELAADRVRTNRFAAIPTWVLLLLLMTGSIAAIVAPMAIIFLSNSSDSINDLSTITIQLAATEASQAIESVISSTTQILEGLVTGPYFIKDFLANAGNVNASTTVFPAMLSSVATGTYVNSIECRTMQTQTAIGIMGPYLNRTDVTAVITAPEPGVERTPIVVHNDPSTNGGLFLETFAFHNFSSYVSTTGIGPAPLTGLDITLAQQNNRSVAPYFDTTYYTVGAFSFWQMTYSKNIWVNPASAGETTPDVNCAVGIVVDLSLSVLLNSVRVTNNTVVLLMDTEGRLLSTNRPNSIATPANVSVRVTPDLSPTTEVALVGKGLLSIFGSYGSIPTGSMSTVYQRTFNDGQPWFLTTSVMNISGTPFTFVVAFPRSDMFAKMDAAEKRGVIIAACVAAAGLICTALMTFLSLRPLYAMAKNMTQLTKFDFSLLENGVLDRRSFLAEIREAETVFDTMVKAFAGAIKRNKQLVDNNRGTSSGGKPNNTMASSV